MKRLICATLLTAVAGSSLWGQARQAANVPLDPAAPGYLNLTKRHPDGLDGPQEFDLEFTSERALQRLGQTRGFLQSFRLLTTKTRRQLTQAELQAIGNTGSDMQTIGFHNIPLTVEGTLLKQDYELAQARYELAQLKHAQRQIPDEELVRARQSYIGATARFQNFWDSKRPTD